MAGDEGSGLGQSDGGDSGKGFGEETRDRRDHDCLRGVAFREDDAAGGERLMQLADGPLDGFAGDERRRGVGDDANARACRRGAREFGGSDGGRGGAEFQEGAASGFCRHRKTSQAKRSVTLPAWAKQASACELAAAGVLPVQLPVVIHCPARRPPVRAAPSLAR